MKRFGFMWIIIILISLSLIFFALQQLLFGNIKDTGFYFFQDMMFLPVNILLVTFIINKRLQSREKQERLEQLNIVIGAFFSEAGNHVLETLNPCIPSLSDIKKLLDMNSEWNSRSFETAANAIKAYPLKADINKSAVERLRVALPQKKAHVLQMFSNPNLLEHDTFTDMLWALYHLIDELENRTDISSLPDSDLEHLSGDAARSYGLLVYEWVFYMSYLKSRYPYLWSLAVRKNPFANNSIIIS